MSEDKDNDVISEKTIKDIIEAIRGIKFGNVSVIVQDSKVVQIDRTEKVRLR